MASASQSVFSAVDLNKVLKGKDRISILVCGRTGVGKSSLINNLIGEEVLPVGDPGAENFTNSYEKLESCTTDVDSHNFIINGVAVTVWDSPGLQDGTVNEEKYLSMMYKACQDVDLVLYCLEIIAARWVASEVRAMELLKNKFGVDFWKKAVLVLTKADMLQQSETAAPNTEGERKEYYLRVYRTLRDRFRAELKTQGVPPVIADHVPAVAASSPMHPKLPNGKNFIAELWLSCLERFSAKSRKKFIIATSALDRIDPNNLGHSRYYFEMDEEQKSWLRRILNETWEGLKTLGTELSTRLGL